MTRMAEWSAYVGELAASSADGHGEEVRGQTLPDEPEYQILVRRMGPFGFRGRAPAGVEVLVIQPGASATSGVAIAQESAGYGPSDLDEGESAMYGFLPDARIKISALGKITIDASAAVDVQVNGGSKSVARVDDLVAANASMASWISAVSTATGVAPPVGFGVITSGASRFKA